MLINELTKFYRISQEWHQKIENWLQSNDYDEKFNDEYKRKRRLANISRRSLENDSGLYFTNIKHIYIKHL